MASSEIKNVSESTTESEAAVADPAENTDTMAIDNVFDASSSRHGDLEKLRMFVEQDGASLSLTDSSDGAYALHFAAINNHPEIVHYIIKHGGDVSAVDNSQETALHWAAVRGCISVADVLLQNGALLEAADENGNRAVHVAAKGGQTSFLDHIVVKHNADFDAMDNDGWSPLHKAASHGSVDTVKWLLSRGANRKRQDKEGRTPLHLATINEKIEVCEVLIDVGTKEEIWLKDNEGNTPIQLVSAKSQSFGAFLLSKALHAECKHLENSNLKREPLQKGKNWPMIIAMQGDAYTGKSSLAFELASRLQCPLISLEDFLDASKATDELDTLISDTFNIIAQIVKTQIYLGLFVVVDSPLSRLSHLQKLAVLVSTENTHNTRLVIIECKPVNEYLYQLRFEERGSLIYAKRWYKPATEWPLPQLPRDYTDDDIPPGVSKLVVDTTDFCPTCLILQALFDVTSCGYGHITKFVGYWNFIHTDKKEQFTCPHCNTTESIEAHDDNLHILTLYEAIDHCEKLCGVCDNQISGLCYFCQECLLTLHESCTELTHGDKNHFTPESFPKFMSSEPHLTYTFPVELPCAECRKDGNGFSSKCKYCSFESHLKSRLVPTVVRHKAHHHFFTLWLTMLTHASTSTCV